jgi:alkanesulfonate monooxygenase SsuD/methylene tetrahydromethanopterin reductase-like flavin-dependent oxidoreductase (luciferase family)
VRLLLGVDGLAAGEPLADLLAAARTAHAAGLDGLWLEESPALAAPLVAAAALAGVPDLRLVCAVRVGERHPLGVAEAAAVADRATGGRVTLALAPAPGAEERLDEALALVRAALAARPFRHDGPTWRVPAGLPENARAGEPLARVTPGPAQLELGVWGWGPEAAAAATARGLGHVAEGPDPLAPAAGPAVRGRVIEAAALDLARLRADRAAGLDLVAVRCPSADRERVAGDLARRLRPRLELASLPEGLEASWEAQSMIVPRQASDPPSMT